MRNQQEPLFATTRGTEVAATPDIAYEVFSDLPRCGQWSVECRGGTWSNGEPARLGSVFRGRNIRGPDVVGWAPVVRGEWFTEAAVVRSIPGRAFAWAMRDGAGRVQQSVWAFEVTALTAGTSALVHSFRMDGATEGILGITAGMDDSQKARFFEEWGTKVSSDIAATLERLRQVIDQHNVHVSLGLDS